MTMVTLCIIFCCCRCLKSRRNQIQTYIENKYDESNNNDALQTEVPFVTKIERNIFMHPVIAKHVDDANEAID